MGKVVKAYGVDLSQWNVIRYYNKIKNAGVQFAIVKVSYGIDRKEPAFDTHMKGCKEAGIPVIGAYIYCYSDTVEKAYRAAYAFVNNTKGQVDTMILDLEDKAVKNLGHKIIDIINAYKTVAIKNGMAFIIYTGASFYNPNLKAYANEIADIPIWWARYPSKKLRTITDVPPTVLPSIPNEIIGWQFSSKGIVSGAEGNLDLNVWYRDIKKQEQPVITIDKNPFQEPLCDITYGSCGEGARWVQWFLWRFGLLTTNGQADVKQIDGIIGDISIEAIKIAQFRLGLPQTGIVDTATREIFKKVC